MKSTTKQIGANSYRITKMTAMSQFHVSRRLGPILATMGISLQTLSGGFKPDVMDFAAVLGPATAVMAKMTDEDANYIIFNCLSVVTRKQGDGWAAVSTDSGLMFDDIEMPEMIRLVVDVLHFNLGNFLQGLVDDASSPSPSPSQEGVGDQPT